MSEVIDISDQQPAIILRDHGGTYHVISFSTLRFIAKGKYPVSNLGDDVLRMIVQEYLTVMEKEHNEGAR